MSIFPPAPYTPEDEAILFRHGRGRWAAALRVSGLQADIRDADLMLFCMQRHWRLVLLYPGEYEAQWQEREWRTFDAGWS